MKNRTKRVPFCQLLQYSISDRQPTQVRAAHNWDTRGQCPSGTDVSSLDSVDVWLF